MESILKIAVQKSGRLNEESIALLKKCGVKFNNGKDQLKVKSHTFPAELYFLRNSDKNKPIAKKRRQQGREML